MKLCTIIKFPQECNKKVQPGCKLQHTKKKKWEKDNLSTNTEHLHSGMWVSGIDRREQVFVVSWESIEATPQC